MRNCTATSLGAVATFFVFRIILLFVLFDRTPTVFRLISKTNMFLPSHEQSVTFLEVGLHFLTVGLLGDELGDVGYLRKFKTEFVLVFVRPLLYLVATK